MIKTLITEKLYGNKKITIYEMEPSARNILTYNDVLGKKINYFLAFPYVQIAARSFDYEKNAEVYASMSRKPADLSLNANEHYTIPLSNCYDNFVVCGITALHKNAVEVFWNSLFHGDGYKGNEYLLKSSMKNLNVWQKMTKIAPEFILSDNCSYGSSPKKLIDTILWD